MFAWAVKIWSNGADTWRDPSEITIHEEKLFSPKEKAFEYVEKYMKDHHFSKDSRIVEKKDGNYMAIDYCAVTEKLSISQERKSNK